MGRWSAVAAALWAVVTAGTVPAWADTFRALFHEMTIKVSGADSGGRLAVIEESSPPGAGPPLHVHAGEDEVFYVMEGTIRFWRGDEQFDRGPGAVVFLPKGVPHSFQVRGSSRSRTLLTILPAGLERFFEEVARRALELPRDMAELETLAGEYGVRILGPPPGASP
ncbi:MAG: cupin domain-containing protein [Alphaproteobacteria bacterium]